VWFRVAVPLGAALNKHRVCHIVRAAGVGEQLVGQVRAVIAVPQMMMWVNDCLCGIDGGFVAQRQPVESVEFHAYIVANAEPDR
jgi:hypothetical protein